MKKYILLSSVFCINGNALADQPHVQKKLTPPPVTKPTTSVEKKAGGFYQVLTPDRSYIIDPLTETCFMVINGNDFSWNGHVLTEWPLLAPVSCAKLKRLVPESASILAFVTEK